MRKIILLSSFLIFMIYATRDSVIAQSTSVVFTIPIPAGCKAIVTTTNVVISCAQNAPLSITTPNVLPVAKVGVPYNADLAALARPTGGVAPYKFSLRTGSTATWLSISSTGVLSGTPTAAGTFTLNYTVMDSSTTATKKSGGSNVSSLNTGASISVSN
jgi:hypothetical protein